MQCPECGCTVTVRKREVEPPWIECVSRHRFRNPRWGHVTSDMSGDAARRYSDADHAKFLETLDL